MLLSSMLDVNAASTSYALRRPVPLKCACRPVPLKCACRPVPLKCACPAASTCACLKKKIIE